MAVAVVVTAALGPTVSNLAQRVGIPRAVVWWGLLVAGGLALEGLVRTVGSSRAASLGGLWPAGALERVGGFGVIAVLRERASIVDLLVKDPQTAEALELRIATSDRAARRLERERRVLERLAGLPGMPRVRRELRVEDRPSLLLETSPAGPLASLAGRLPPADLVPLARRVTSLVRGLHGRGVVHRVLDIDRVGIDAHGRLSLRDFTHAGRPGSTRPVPSAVVSLRAPEQLGPASPVGMEEDLFGLGRVLFALVTGRPAGDCASLGRLDAGEARRRLRAALAEEGERTRSELTALTLELLHPDPAERPNDVERRLARILARREGEVRGV